MLMTMLTTPLALKDAFTQKINHEFLQESAIHPLLYQTATQIVGDLEVLPGGDISTPIHDALNWTYTRFGYQAKENMYAVLLLNEDGSCWQLKLSQPRINQEKGKIQKYETPVNSGSRAYFPPIPPAIREKIGDRHNITVPLEGSFWDWLAQHPEIPITVTEGGKKALSLLSQGFVAIALYGASGGYRKQLDEQRSLILDLTRFTVPGRAITLAFDQDEKAQTRNKVAKVLLRFGGLLQAAGSTVTVATWDGRQGKGVDDLIANAGVAAWQVAAREALSLEHWQIWQRLEHRLSYAVNLRVATADLSTLDLTAIPAEGLVAIASAKGTGKTKLIAELVKESDKTLAALHRIALAKNLSNRLRLDYRGDLDKVNGEFINGSAYTLRIGFCVDSLLTIDPSKFVGCELILDEVVQVIRHLLTSSTCAKDGKRPALLARLRELIQGAKRIIVADADLDNATLSYLHDLRGESSPVFLIQNDQPPQGYPVRFIHSSDRSVITQDLLKDIEGLELGKVIFVTTDSRGTSKQIARLIAQCHADKRVLLLNAETSGGEAERRFMLNPDAILSQGEYDIIICSPSMATGVSIEAQAITKVYGIFIGCSSTDADMAQALGRVRDPIERIIWCARRGSNFAKVSRSTNFIELKSHLHQATTATVSLVRSSLREDTLQGFQAYDWSSDPHVNLFSRIATDQNFAMLHLREALLVRLRYEGNQVQVEEREANPALRSLLQQTKAELTLLEAEAMLATETLTQAEVLTLEQREFLTADDQRAIAKFYLMDFYGLDHLTLDNILWDQDGQRRKEILNLEAQLYDHLAGDRSAKSLEKQHHWQQGSCPWDISQIALRKKLREQLHLDTLLQKMTSGWEWTSADLAPYAAKARTLKLQIQIALNFTISDKMSDTQIVHQLLKQLGLKFAKFRWSRSVPGQEGTKVRVFRLDLAHWQTLTEILSRRKAKREAIASSTVSATVDPTTAPTRILNLPGSPPWFSFDQLGGDPGAVPLQPPTVAQTVAQTVEEAIAQLARTVPNGRNALMTVFQSWESAFRSTVILALWERSDGWLEELCGLLPELCGWIAA
jgi:Domain of unknown function (DUF3854)